MAEESKETGKVVEKEVELLLSEVLDKIVVDTGLTKKEEPNILQDATINEHYVTTKNYSPKVESFDSYLESKEIEAEESACTTLCFSVCRKQRFLTKCLELKFSHLGSTGIGAWKTGVVTSDVILRNIVN